MILTFKSERDFITKVHRIQDRRTVFLFLNENQKHAGGILVITNGTTLGVCIGKPLFFPAEKCF